MVSANRIFLSLFSAAARQHTVGREKDLTIPMRFFVIRSRDHYLRRPEQPMSISKYMKPASEPRPAIRRCSPRKNSKTSYLYRRASKLDSSLPLSASAWPSLCLGYTRRYL